MNAHVNWPNDDHDTQLFQTPANQTTDTHDYPSGHVTVSFDNSDPDPEEGELTLKYPDYESPHDHDEDNTYHLRVVNDNDLEQLTLGCTGSAVDLAITIKDVGPPVAPPNLTGAFQVGDATAMDVSWSEPSGFLENKVIIPFPHADLGVTKYQYQYRWDDQQPWSDVLETDDTSVSIPGLDQAGYHVQVRATSTEGEGDWSQIIVGTLSNRAPSITRPTNHNRDILYKFPDGKPAIVEYNQEPGSDPDGDPITYLFRIALPNVTDISPLADGLLTFTRNGNNFEITANEEVSPTEFITVYGEEGYDQASTAIYSSDGTLESGPSEFAITVYYESSAYFDDADARAADQRFIFTDPLETYEGPTAGDDITINWSAAIRGTRTWGTGNPNNAIACRDTSDTATSHTWPSTGKEDSAQFDAPTTPTTNRSNTITPTFTNEPDFENPADQNSDNIYLVRFYNTHDLHNQTPESKNPSCSGSAADLQIKVKDVGTPEPIVLTADFNSSDNTKIDLSWPAPTGFVEENGSTVTFPHTDFNPSSYDYRYRATSSDPWIEVTGLTGTPETITGLTQTSYDIQETITGLTQTSYDIQAKANNSEGASPWPTTFTTVTRSSVPDTTPIPTVSSRNTTSITIEWTAPNDNGSPITSYRVRHKKNTDSSWGSPETPTSNNLTISSLEQGTSYDFKVRAINDMGRGQWSEVLTTSTVLPNPEASIQTLTSSIAERQPAQFQIDLDRTTSVTVNLTYAWTGGYGSATGDTLTFTSSDSETISIPTNQSSSNSNGSLTVTVNTGTGYAVGSPNSANTTITRNATPPSRPDAPTVDGLSTTSIRVTWRPPSSQLAIDRYRIQHRQTATEAWTQTPHGTGSTT